MWDLGIDCLHCFFFYLILGHGTYEPGCMHVRCGEPAKIKHKLNVKSRRMAHCYPRPGWYLHTERHARHSYEQKRFEENK